MPGPQPGEKSGQRPLDYYTDVQPVLDKHCVECHSGDEPEGGMNLSGEAVGTDKLGHFFQQGHHDYVEKATNGEKSAEDWNRDSEYVREEPVPGLPGRTWSVRGTGRFGEATTGVMSPADMEANRQGGRFYSELAAAHKAGKAFKFDIGRYVGRKWNENKNPNQYVPEVGKVVAKNTTPEPKPEEKK